ncbi:MAG: SAF domain-containing protein [Brachybacterium sp.]|nr:SAF domain-containing protein [Brachybacterium sp.]MDN5898450.1 SAF domain-containing protein [Brachybacterium sp.]
MLPRLRAHLPVWRRALRRRRRLLVALAVTALVAALLPSMLPPSARGVEVVVVDVALAPGTVLTPTHLSTARIAEDLVPAGAVLGIEQVLGRTTRIPLGAGAPLLPGMLEASGAAAVPEGSVLMTVPVPQSLVPHLPPGARIELVPMDPTASGSSGIPARVLEVVASDSLSPALGSGGTGTAEVLVTVEQGQARELAHALGFGAVVVTVIG